MFSHYFETTLNRTHQVMLGPACTYYTDHNLPALFTSSPDHSFKWPAWGIKIVDKLDTMLLCWCLKGPILNFQKQKIESDDGVSRKLILLFQDCFSKCLIKSWQFNGHVGFKIFNWDQDRHSNITQLGRL